MKNQIKFLLPACFMLCMIFSTNAVQAQNPKMDKDKDKMKMDHSMSDMPYTATYSSKFAMGDPAHSKLILDIWKDWDDNMVDRHASMFADTVTMIFSSGDIVKGKEKAMSMAKDQRAGMGSAKSTVHAFMSLKSLDKNENWVAVWGEEEDTDKDGKKTTTALHEIWMLNKDGKVAFMHQFSGKVPQGQ